MSDAPKPARPWLRIALFVSLALNLAVIGLAAGTVFKSPKRPAGFERGPVAPYTRAFDSTQRRELGKTLRDAYRAGKRSGADGPRADLMADYRKALEVLQTSPFDPDAFRAIVADQSARSAELRKPGEAILANYLAEMSDSDRADYARRLEDEIEEFGNGRKKQRRSD